MPADGRGLVSGAGDLLVTETARVTGLTAGLSAGVARWCQARAVHDPGKIIADLAASVAMRGDCLADIGVQRGEPELHGPVVSRTITALAADPAGALKAIRAARAAARERAWALAGTGSPGSDGGPVIIDLDATLVISHSEKENAAPTWKKGFGFRPLAALPTTAPAPAASRWPSCSAPAAPPGPDPHGLYRRDA